MGVDPEDKEPLVEQLLEEDSPIRQKEIVSETGWSESLTSQLLDHMESEDKVYRYWIGREKYVCQPDEKPDYLK